MFLLGCLTEQKPVDGNPNGAVNTKTGENTPRNTFLIPQVNSYPRAIMDKVSLMEDSSIVLQSVLVNDTDADGDSLNIVSFSQGESGGKVIEIASNLLRYIPEPNFYGKDSIFYTISDGNGGEATTKIDIMVRSVNDLPSAKPDRLLVPMDEEKSFNVLINDSGLGDAVSLEVTEDVLNGELTYLGDGDFSYMPFVDYLGQDSFDYEITDSNGDVSVATVTLQVGCTEACRVFTLSWDASISTDVVAYKVYMGIDGEALSLLADVGSLIEYEYFTHEVGEYVFAVTAINAQSIESELSLPQAASF